MGRLAVTLFERRTQVSDPDTYDITSWSVPVTFGLKALYTSGPLPESMEPLETWAPPAGQVTGDGAVALLVDAAQHRFPEAAGAASRHELSARVAGEPFTIDGRSFQRGSLIVHTIRNSPEAIAAFLDEIKTLGLNAYRAASGMTDQGPVLGANANRRFVLPRPILLRGEPISGNSYGQVWHLLDMRSPLPYVPVNVDGVGRVDLDRYNVIVVPNVRGGLSRSLGESGMERIRQWVRDGGVIVTLAGASSWALHEVLQIERDDTDEADKDDEGGEDDEDQPPSSLSYEERRLRRVDERIPGTALAVNVDRTHPLAAGVPSWLGVLKQGTRTLPVRDDTYVVARFDEEPKIGAVLSDANAEKVGGTPLMTHHRMGRGAVICFSDDVSFRSFQHAGVRLLLNAIVHGPSL
jgi:hypothetical protein